MAREAEERAMTNEEFAGLLRKLTTAAEAGDGERFAACFTMDAVYHDYVYGDHRGRAAIAQMLEELFHRDAADYRWAMFDPVCSGRLGYAWSLSTFTSKIPEFAGRRVVIDGVSRFELKEGLISDYRESVNGGVAMVQLGVAAPRLEKVLQRWAKELRERPAVRDYLAHP
jgi:hypothetical protein